MVSEHDNPEFQTITKKLFVEERSIDPNSEAFLYVDHIKKVFRVWFADRILHNTQIEAEAAYFLQYHDMEPKVKTAHNEMKTAEGEYKTIDDALRQEVLFAKNVHERFKSGKMRYADAKEAAYEALSEIIYNVSGLVLKPLNYRREKLGKLEAEKKKAYQGKQEEVGSYGDLDNQRVSTFRKNILTAFSKYCAKSGDVDYVIGCGIMLPNKISDMVDTIQKRLAHEPSIEDVKTYLSIVDRRNDNVVEQLLREHGYSQVPQENRLEWIVRKIQTDSKVKNLILPSLQETILGHLVDTWSELGFNPDIIY